MPVSLVILIINSDVGSFKFVYEYSLAVVQPVDKRLYRMHASFNWLSNRLYRVYEALRGFKISTEAAVKNNTRTSTFDSALNGQRNRYSFALTLL